MNLNGTDGITRRGTIRLTGMSLMYLSDWLPAAMAACTVRVSSGASQIHWPRFLDLLGDLAKERDSAQKSESEYVERTFGLLKSLGSAGIPRIRPISLPPLAHPQFDDLKRAVDYQVTLISLSPGNTIPAHDHPGMTGVSKCMSGRLAMSEYDLLSQSKASGQALLRLVRTREMAAGDTACVMTERSNIHRLVSKAPTELLDIFAPPYDDARRRRSRWYHLDRRQQAPGVYRATVERV